ncbi:MAG: hypothetical protein ACYCZJ_13310 [Sulfuriferula sp.]
MSTSKLYCAHCGKLCADLIAGSKTRKGMVVICAKCWKPKPVSAKPYPSDDDMVDVLHKMFRMKP